MISTPPPSILSSPGYWTAAQPKIEATIERNRAYFPHTPTLKQLIFLLMPHLEALYGGAAGGGKSDALLMAAAMYFHVPGYHALILRRSYVDLARADAIMTRSKEWWMGAATWSEKDKRWTFPSGSTCTFSYLATDADVYSYQGAAFHYIGYDELTQFSAFQYRYLLSRLRRLAGFPVPLRMRAASNPGGIGHEWVRQRFLVEGATHGRVFVPAGLADNPHLDAAEYRKSLDQLDPVTRAQLLNGDWSARQNGGYFKREWLPIVDAAPAEARRVRWWDFAATEATGKNDPDFTVGALLSRTRDGIIHLEDIRRVRTTPAGVEALVRQTAETDGRGVEVWLEQEPGSAGKSVADRYVRLLQGFTVHAERSTGPKEEYAKPFSSQCEAGNVRLVRGPWIGALLDELEAFPQGAHDDQADACSKAFAKLARGPAQPFAWLTDDPAFRARHTPAPPPRDDAEAVERRVATYLRSHLGVASEDA